MARLHWTARKGNYAEAVNCLMEGQDVNAISVHHFSALMLAAREGHLPVVKLLLEAGADVNLTHPNQRTALHFAAGSGHLDIVQELTAYKADVNALSRSGCTPAIEAAQFNHRNTVLFLQQYGADFSLKNKQGRTAEDWLALGGVQGQFKRQFPDGVASLPGVRKSSENHVRALMSEGLSAEEYAAKHGRRTLIWSYGHQRFADTDVEKWALRVADILFTPGLLDECEEQFLQGAELEDARKCRARRTKSETRRNV